MSCELCTSKPGEEPVDIEWEDLCEECQYWIHKRQKEVQRAEA